jgi:hypothetical protein
VVCSTQAGSARGSDTLSMSHADFVARQTDEASSIITFARGEESAQCIIQVCIVVTEKKRSKIALMQRTMQMRNYILVGQTSTCV